jgi:hypothetical protein
MTLGCLHALSALVELPLRVSFLLSALARAALHLPAVRRHRFSCSRSLHTVAALERETEGASDRDGPTRCEGEAPINGYTSLYRRRDWRIPQKLDGRR